MIENYVFYLFKDCSYIQTCLVRKEKGNPFSFDNNNLKKEDEIVAGLNDPLSVLMDIFFN